MHESINLIDFDKIFGWGRLDFSARFVFVKTVDVVEDKRLTEGNISSNDVRNNAAEAVVHCS